MPEDLWFSRSGNDLHAQLLGTADQVRVLGWYADKAARVTHLSTSRGDLIAADQVEQLVQAIAGFGVEPAAVIALTPEQQTNYSAMVTAYWGTAGEMQA